MCPIGNPTLAAPRWALRLLALLVVLNPCPAPALRAQTTLPVGSAPRPLVASHFPDRLHAVVWRNWELVEPARIAQAVGTSERHVRELAESMGLPPVTAVPAEWRRRGYITVLRRNWHLLPYEQILTLLDMSADELALALREDDFLFIKLGSAKPQCEPVRWKAPAASAARRASQIRRLVERRFGDRLATPGEAPFQFVRDLSRIQDPTATANQARPEVPRIVYSYFATFGDPLIDRQLDPYPDGLLHRLAEKGITGVWLHAVLRQLAPGGAAFPEFGEGHVRRLENLRDLVERARRYGISVYLYINEPRAMPEAFFAERPEMEGVAEGDWRAMCTSHPAVRAWLRDALAHVFTEVPNLGGILTITASENLTHCASHGGHRACPRCGKRTDDEIIAEVVAAMEEGVHRGNPEAKVIAWDWGWKGHGDATSILSQLPRQTWLMSVSEWAKPLERGGVKLAVGEYAMSVVGPGPRATRHWEFARRQGHRVAAKMQVSATWELSSVPYLPVMDLVAQHFANLAPYQLDGYMLSWTVGGYPSPNLRIADYFTRRPDATVDDVLDALALEQYGPQGADDARAAWSAFSRAFSEYPYHGGLLYYGPQHLGPANLLYAHPTGYRASMVGFPYDDLSAWRGPYPVETFIEQMERVAGEWFRGLEPLRRAVDAAPPERRSEAEAELRFARAAHIHFASVAHQARFVRARDALTRPDTDERARQRWRNEMVAQLDAEIALAEALFDLARADSRIGFEASNQYYYRPLDLVEKVINCQFLRDQLASAP